MTSHTQTSPFDSLCSLGLITDSQREQARVHPRRDELEGHPGEVDALVWLVVRNIVSEESLAETSERLISRYTGEAFRERRDLLDSVLDKLLAVRELFNGEALASLLSDGLIDQSQHARTVPLLPREHAFASPAAALAWLVINEHLSAAEFNALRARVAAESGLSTAHKRVEIMAQTEDLLTKAGAAVRKAVASAFWSEVFPGPRWMWIGGLVLLVGGMVWYTATPSSTPECDSSSTRKTVDAMLFSTTLRARSDILGGGRDLPAGTPRLTDAKEIGYARPDRIRGCIGKLSFNGDKVPYAYTIAPSPTEKGGFVVTGADETLVQARFGHLDAEGHYAHKAEPMGREAVEVAFRAGVESMNQDAGNSSLRRLLQRSRQHSGAEPRGAPAREREIAEIEPLEPCREVKAGTRCKLLIERNDPLLAALGHGSSTLLQGDFSFERSGPEQPWGVSPEFPQEFAKAVVAARIDQVTGAGHAVEPAGKASAP